MQIGDIHYPEWRPAPVPLDIKTSQIGTEILKNLSVDKFQNLLRATSQEALVDECDAVILMGDITSWGDIAAQDRAIRHLAALFRINPVSASPKFHAVPGNHDVNRELALKLGMAGKFDHLKAKLAEAGFSSLPVLRATRLKSGDAKRQIQLILTNTTLGSWEKTGLPEQVIQWVNEIGQRPAAKIALDSIPNSIPMIDPDSYYDQMDTPFVSKETLNDIKLAIDVEGDDSIPVVVGHHNLLPQSLPRISPFGELLNQGEFRKALYSLNRPILYLHGHIHESPVEFLSSAEFPSSQIICISAPLFLDGVNIIDLFFNETGDALGVEVTGLRPDDSGHVKPTVLARVPIRGALYGLVRSTLAQRICGVLSGGRSTWMEIVEGVSDLNRSEEEIEGAILELSWSSIVRIFNDGVSRQRWVMELSR